MKKLSKHLLSLLLCLVLLVPAGMAQAFEPVGTLPDRGETSGSVIYVNPFYKNVTTEAQLTELARSLRAGAETAAAPRYSTVSDAAAYFRKQLVARADTISFAIPGNVAVGLIDPYNVLYEAAVAHTESCTGQEGDALLWVVGGWNVSWKDSGSDVVYTYTVKYYTTAAQEATLTSEVNSAMTALKLSAKTETQKVRAIYDFICDRVNYDYDHVNDSSYELQYTAYAAMHNRTAVCQGYSVLFYRMCKEAGLDVRVVTSTDHAWNIVRIGSVYYNVDATWDGGDDETTHNWYLKGMREFPDHFREEPYNQEDFEIAYPMVRDPDLNKANLQRTFTTVDGGSVSTAASAGKPTLLIFGDVTDEYGTINLLHVLAKYGLGSMNVIYADCGTSSAYSVENEVFDEGEQNVLSRDEVTACWNKDDACRDALWDYLERCGFSGGTVYVPVLIYIDADNRIQHYSIGPITEHTVKNYFEEYLGLTLGQALPRITMQPDDTYAAVGYYAYFHMNFHGTAHLQWYYRTGPSGTWTKWTGDGAKSRDLSVLCTAEMDGWQFTCRVYNASGYVLTRVATLEVYTGPKILTQPTSVSAPVGDTAVFHVDAYADAAVYRWQYKPATGTTWTECSEEGYNTDTLSVPVTAGRNGCLFRCEIRDMWGITIHSNAATLKVNTTITAQPKDVSAAVGTTAKVTVSATGAGLTYQWQHKVSGREWKNSTATGYNTAAMSVKVNSGGWNGCQFRCVITDANGVQTVSDAATLTVKTVITAQPRNTGTIVGTPVKFTVTATGAGLTYQWQHKPAGGGWKNSTASGYNTAAMRVNIHSESWNGCQFRCVITDANGVQTVSNVATLTVGPVAVSVQPEDISTAIGTTAEFTLTALGTDLTYQWQHRAPGGAWKNSTATGCNTAAMSVSINKAGWNGYQFRCVVTDADGNEVTSDVATLTVKTNITAQPADLSVPIGGTARLTVKATGVGLTYQWQHRAPGGSWKNSSVTGYNTAVMSLDIGKAGWNGYQFRCVITDANGVKTISNAATLKVKTTITAQPQNTATAVGNTVKFTVTATGAGLKYQWQHRAPGGAWKNSTATGYNTAAMSVNINRVTWNGYQFRCVITDANGVKTISGVATLTVK
ncbi:MAG: hypothetical protein II069_06635 [Oscillospiraceae bacterium]|nr:hypothetical protein [Oscillospiraceae bacterium]